MNSILLTYVSAPVASPSLADLALDRLGAWLDAERSTLERLLAQSGQKASC